MFSEKKDKSNRFIHDDLYNNFPRSVPPTLPELYTLYRLGRCEKISDISEASV